MENTDSGTFYMARLLYVSPDTYIKTLKPIRHYYHVTLFSDHILLITQWMV